MQLVGIELNPHKRKIKVKSAFGILDATLLDGDVIDINRKIQEDKVYVLIHKRYNDNGDKFPEYMTSIDKSLIIS